MNSLPSYEWLIANEEVNMISGTSFQWTLNLGDQPSTQDRARIGNYYFVHLVKTVGGTNLGYGAWQVSILDNCSADNIFVWDGPNLEALPVISSVTCTSPPCSYPIFIDFFIEIGQGEYFDGTPYEVTNGEFPCGHPIIQVQNQDDL